MSLLDQIIQYEEVGVQRQKLHTQIIILYKYTKQLQRTLHLQSLMVAQTVVSAVLLINQCI